MKIAGMLLCALLLSLSGCILTSGQITTSFSLNDIYVKSADSLKSHTVDLSTNKDYNDHKDKLKGVVDFAVLGTVTNESGPANSLDVVVYIDTSEASTDYNSDPDVRAHATKLWGPFSLAPSETKSISWDTSAGLFTADGKAQVIAKIKNGGKFRLYALGASGDYKFDIPDARMVLVLDAGI